jgi:hypothetical protein
MELKVGNYSVASDLLDKKVFSYLAGTRKARYRK